MLLKELPGDITTSTDTEKQKKENKKVGEHMTFDEWLYEGNNLEPRVMNDSGYSDEENGKYYWGLHKKYNEYVKQWGNSMFGPDTPRKSIDFGPSKSIVSEQSEEAWVLVNNNDLDTNIERSEETSEHSRESQLSTEIGNDSGPELEDTIEGPGQKHELGIHCTQCHKIYLNKYSYNTHECMQLINQSEG
jgi:hypothetical protein